MIKLEEITRARHQLLERLLAYFSNQPEVMGILLSGSIPSGTADPYSDLDLRIIATPEHHAYLVENRLAIPTQWSDWLFNEWLEGTEHCVSHFRPFLKADIFYWREDQLIPSPWHKLPIQVLLDRSGVVEKFLDDSSKLAFPVTSNREASRILSKSLACAHEVLRRARRGELFYAHTLLEELRSYLILIEDWLMSFNPKTAGDLKLQNRISSRLDTALRSSYVAIDSNELEKAVVRLSELFLAQIPELYDRFNFDRVMENDLHAVRLVSSRQVAEM